MRGIIMIILIIIVFLIGSIIISKSKPDDNFKQFIGILLIISSPFIGVITYQNIGEDEKEPTALDVYRGKTTLEITYRDSIPVDTIVVFKDKIK